MVINPLQIGPCTLDEVCKLFSQLTHTVTQTEGYTLPLSRDQAVEILHAGTQALAKRRRATNVASKRQALIRSIFEGTVALPSAGHTFGWIATRYAEREPEGKKLPYKARKKIEHGIIEAIALYLPRYYHGDRYGIYLNGSRLLSICLHLGEQHRDSLVVSVSLHELFHAYIEEIMNPEEYHKHHVLHQDHKDHKDKYCQWEEAAANKVAVDWCTSPGCPLGNFPDEKDKFMQRLFRTRSQGGFPGYGDWPMIPQDYPVVIPGFLMQGRCIKPIQETERLFALHDILSLAEKGSFSENAVHKLFQGLNLWYGMYNRFLTSGEEVVPIYLDLVPWGT